MPNPTDDARLDLPADAGPTRGRWLAAGVMVVTLATFLPSIGNGFVEWDDDHNFVRNPNYRGLGPDKLRWMFTTFHQGPYQPLSWVTLGLDYLLWGMNPAGYHATNVVLHALAAALFSVVAATLARTRLRSAAPLFGALAALIWGLHPLRVEAVSWVTERREVLCGALSMLTILAHVRGRPWWMTTLLGIAAMLAKGTAVVLPGLLVLCDLYQSTTTLRRSLVRQLPLLLAAAALAGVAIVAQHDVAATVSLSRLGLLDRFKLLAYGLGFYAWRTVNPVGLAPLYEARTDIQYGAQADLSFLTPAALIGGGAVVTVLVLGLVWRRRAPAILLLAVAYIAMVLPVGGLVQVGSQVAADRYAYQAGWVLSIGVAALGWTLIRRGARVIAPVIPLLLVGGAILTLIVLTVRQQKIWRDTDSLWTHQLRLYPDTAVAHYNYGLYLMSRKPSREDDAEKAEREFRAAVAKFPHYANAHGALGDVLRRRGRVREAIASYQAALAWEPRLYLAIYGLANAHWDLGQRDEALRHFRLLTEYDPHSADSHLLLARVLAAAGDPRGAVAAFERAIGAQPDSAAALSAFAVFLSTHPDRDIRDGRRAVDLATRAYRRVYGIDPPVAPPSQARPRLRGVDRRVTEALVAALAQTGAFDQASAVLDEAILAAPDDLQPTLQSLKSRIRSREPIRHTPKYP